MRGPRFSGGGTVLIGPGCLNFTIALSQCAHPQVVSVSRSFEILLGRIAEGPGSDGVSMAGGTDLALDGKKVSGNAQRRGRRALLHHGTLLYDCDARLVTRYLREPRRQPGYRASRTHGEFIGQLPLSRETMAMRLAGALAPGLVHDSSKPRDPAGAHGLYRSAGGPGRP